MQIRKQRRAHALLLDTGKTLKAGWNNVTANLYDSIVSLLALKDKFSANKELDQ